MLFRSEVEIVGLAEIDQTRIPKALKILEKNKKKAPAVHSDFRRLVDDPSIDILVVGTPDHWHAIPAILACQAGKHVYVEKPMSHDVAEGRIAVEAQKKYGVVVQHGTQNRSKAGIAGLHEAIQAGKFGKLKISIVFQD